MKDLTALLFIVNLFTGQCLFAQTFAKRFERFNFSPRPVATIVQTVDSGFIYAGTIDSLNHNYHISLLKVDNNGDTVWTTIITAGDSSNCQISDITMVDDSSYILTGNWEYDTPVDSSQGISLIKFDFYGNIIWNKMLVDYSNFSQGGRIIKAFDKGFLILSNSIIKIDSLGEFVWAKKYPTYGLVAEDVTLTSDSCMIMLSQYNDTLLIWKTDINGNLLWRERFPNMGYNPRIIAAENGTTILIASFGRIFKIASTGIPLWTICTDIGPGFFSNTISKSHSEDYIISGLSGYLGLNSYALLKLDSNGTLLSLRGMNSSDPYGRCILNSFDGGFVIGGAYFIDTIAGGQIYLNAIPMITKTDSLFNVGCFYSDTFSIMSYPYSYPIIHDTDLVTVAHNYQMHYPQAWTISHGCQPVDLCATTVIENPFSQKNNRISPNPTTGKFKIESLNAISEISIYNMLGNLVYHVYRAGDDVSIDLSDYPRGIYIYTLTTESTIETGKVILQ
jgi:hypothetical protein